MRGKGFKHSEETKKKISLSLIGHKVTEKCRSSVGLTNSLLKGPRARNWKGGRLVKRSGGYICIHKPKHPNASVSGYVKEHRLVIEKKIGRYLHRWEVVHHVNEIKIDNRPENLEIMNVGDHVSLHKKGIKYG